MAPIMVLITLNLGSAIFAAAASQALVTRFGVRPVLAAGMLFLIAGFIGTIFIGMVIPIFSLQDHIK